MADKTQKTPKNVPGKYYVDQNCVGCTACTLVAPDFFAFDEETNVAYVCKQPNDEAQTDQCEQALGNCPVEAIGNDDD